ncbi:MAG: response regulator transcription factor [Acidobacteriota bacterium]
MNAPLRLHLIYGSRLLADIFAAGFARREEVELLNTSDLDTTTAETLDAEALDALLIDASVDPDAALTLIRRIASRAKIEIVVLGVEEPEQIVRFLEAGATGCSKRDATLEELLEMIRALQRQEAVCCPRLTASVIERLFELSRQVAEERPAAATIENVRLTDREGEVLELIAAGYQNKEIARKLGISLPTVKNHVHKVIDKLNARGRREAVRLAYLNGFLADPLSWLDGGVRGEAER